MIQSSRTPGGWRSRTLWAFFILCGLSLVFLFSWMHAVHYIGDIAFDLAMSDKDVPGVFMIIIQAFPLGAIVSGVAAAGVALIGGNKARDAAANFRKNENIQSEDNHSTSGK